MGQCCTLVFIPLMLPKKSIDINSSSIFLLSYMGYALKILGPGIYIWFFVQLIKVIITVEEVFNLMNCYYGW